MDNSTPLLVLSNGNYEIRSKDFLYVNHKSAHVSRTHRQKDIGSLAFGQFLFGFFKCSYKANLSDQK